MPSTHRSRRMLSSSLVVWSCLLLLLLQFPTETNAVKNHGRALVDWLRSHDRGYFSEKIALHSTSGSNSDTDDDVRNGVFAEAAIAKNETLVVIPEECLLRSSDGPFTEDDSEDMCDTALNLVREYYLADNSTFAPYVDYVMGHMRTAESREADRHRLPADWSDEGLELIESIVGTEMDPQGLWDVDFRRQCSEKNLRELQTSLDNLGVTISITENADTKDKMEELVTVLQEAWRTVISRSWNEVMVPIYDMMNHRNGQWHNADQLNTVHERGSDLHVVALRDIQKGEQIYISYNECNDDDCEGMEHKYVVQQIFKDYGFVEQYPRRWRFDFSELGAEEDEEEDVIVLEIDQVNPTENVVDDEKEELKLTWLSEEPPSLDRMHMLHGHWQKQRLLKPFVEQSLAKLQSNSERETIRDYYEAFSTALEMAVQYADVTPKAVVDLSDDEFDALKVHNAKPGAPIPSSDSDDEDDTVDLEGDELALCSGDSSTYMGEAGYDDIGEMISQYQSIKFEHNEEMNDTCLYLSNWLQTCTSWRPHYHESVVHYPARFVNNLKRVIYLGGGDNMLLHEILKYPSLEVVMGMELDQEVVRSSFKYLGTQPHFDNPKVQWWFGDATKSLSMLLEQGDEFYGTFDLVIVDLQTNVAETLMVTRDKTIMDVAMQLLQPDGVLARNEDFYPRRSVGFAKYEVDLEYLDVPMLCQQSITIGSTSVDFLTKDLTGHSVETVYLNQSSLDDGTDKFSRWLNYRNNDIPDLDPGCDQSDKNQEEEERGFGVHMILEVEDTKVAKEKPEKVYTKIRSVMTKLGLTELSTTEAPNNALVSVVLFVEGYVGVQIWPNSNYIALDVKLFSNFGKLELARSQLVAALSDDPDKPSASSLRVVTGGMFGVPRGTSAKQAPTCGEKGTLDAAAVESITDGAITTIVQKAAALGTKTNPVVAVVCPDSDSSCAAFGALRGAEVKNVIPMMTCPGIESDKKKMNDCVKETSAALLSSVASLGKIDLIVVDTSAPVAMGQILHKILRDKPQRLKLLQEQYAIMTVSLEPSPTSWQHALLERFQTEFDLHSPAQRALVLFESQANKLEVGLFSTGGIKVFHSMGGFLAEVEKETSLVGHLRKVDDGVLKYHADFMPNVIGSTGDFDRDDSSKQWSSQTATGHQTILQFEIKPSQSKLESGAIVLVNYEQDVWKGAWGFGKVVEEQESGMYTVIMDADEEEEQVEVSRDALLLFENESTLEVREPVLIERNGYWSQGAVIEELPEEGMFKVRRYDSDGDVMTVHRSQLVSRIEGGDDVETPSLSSKIVNDMLTSALRSVEVDVDDESGENSLELSGGIAEGCIITAFWPEGHAVASWDGRSHIDVSVYTTEEDDVVRDVLSAAITEELPYLKQTSRDEIPRGYGRVVNFNSEQVDGVPHWAVGLEEEEEEDAME